MIYFAVLVPLSAVFEALMISGSLSWVLAFMWTPAAASVVARLVSVRVLATCRSVLGDAAAGGDRSRRLSFRSSRADHVRHRLDDRPGAV